jgi:sugar lactone lactonase YvrE
MQKIILCLLLLSLVAAAPKVTLIAGGGPAPDGSPAKDAALHEPFAVDFDKSGNLFIAEYGGHSVRKISPDGLISTIAGNGQEGFAGDGGLSTKSQLAHPHSLVVAPNGDIYIADTGNRRVRRIDAQTSIITTFAGTGEKGFAGDGGPADKAQFGEIYCVCFGPKAERMYLADLDNRRIRAIDMRTNIVTTVAGNRRRGVPDDGADAATSPLIDPRAVAADASGNVYILERSGNALRVVNPAGKIRTVAGTGKQGNTGDNGPAREATLNGPKHLCIDRDENVLICDTENNVIRKYLPKEGKIVRIAGTGKPGSEGLGSSPLETQLSRPHGVYVHRTGAIYIADSENNRILRIGN